MQSPSRRIFAATFIWAVLSLVFFAFTTATAQAQGDLDGVIDFHVHSNPDSDQRSIDAIDLARLAKQRGMRGLVLKNHYESTAALAYVVRKIVPGIEIFGGIDLNLTVGGMNPAAVERMTMLTGGWGRVVWMATNDNEAQVKSDKQNRPFVAISKDGHLLPEVEQVLDVIAKHQLILETGHSSATDSLLLVHEGKLKGIKHMVVTHAIASVVRMSIPQMQEASRDGAYLEFTYSTLIPKNAPFTTADYVRAIKAIGPEWCILASDLGQKNNPLHPDGLAQYFKNLKQEGLTQAEIDLMSKTNPAKALGLE
jgi:uncharacterized protein DUF6282